MSFHPMQEIVMINGVARFKENEIISFLMDNCKYNLNQLHEQFGKLFSIEDWIQFYQQIGYSTSGYGDLSFIPQDIVQKADEIAELVQKGVVEYTEENQPSKTKPDILVVNNEGVVSIYSNNPEALGTVLRFDLEEEPGGAVETIPDKIKGEAKDWKDVLYEHHNVGSAIDLSSFLEEFIITNTQET